MSSLNLSSYSFVLFPHVLSSVPGEKRAAPPSPLPLLRRLQRALRSPLSLLFSRVDNPSVLSSQDMPSSSSTSFAAPKNGNLPFWEESFLLFFFLQRSSPILKSKKVIKWLLMLSISMTTHDNIVSGKKAPAWVSMEIIFLRILEWKEACWSSLLMNKGLAYATCVSSDRKHGKEKWENTACKDTQWTFSFAQ